MGYKLQATNNICWVCSKKGKPRQLFEVDVKAYVRPSKHGIDSMVINLGGIAPEGSLSVHTVGAHFC
jgi:hypothetical protein